MLNTFSKRLKTMRVEAGVSQSQLSKRLGYKSAQFVSNWERGLSYPPPRDVRKIADKIGAEYTVFSQLYIDSKIKAAEDRLIKRLKRG